MGMKPKATNAVSSVPPVPKVPQANLTTVIPKPIQAVEKKERAGDNAGFSEKMTKQDWADKSIGISIDAIHKSSLEGNTLAQATIGLSWPDMLKKSEEFVRFHVKLNQKLKAE